MKNEYHKEESSSESFYMPDELREERLRHKLKDDATIRKVLLLHWAQKKGEIKISDKIASDYYWQIYRSMHVEDIEKFRNEWGSPHQTASDYLTSLIEGGTVKSCVLMYIRIKLWQIFRIFTFYLFPMTREELCFEIVEAVQYIEKRDREREEKIREKGPAYYMSHGASNEKEIWDILDDGDRDRWKK